MTNLAIEFLNSPWWLLLLIPAFFLALFPHFRIAKKYRRNRNRIISLVLHLVVMSLCIFALSGVRFTYDLLNTNNEVIVLVDMSHSSENFADTRYDKDDFVRQLIDQSGSKYKIGVVTFGSDQVYAAEMSTDTDKVYRDYLASERPDDSASDLAGALEYARSLFTGGGKGKVVIVSDGAETDGDAMTAVRMMAANGIQVNSAYLPNDYSGNDEVLISDLLLPDYNVTTDDPFNVTVTVRARNAGLGLATITVYDDSAENEDESVLAYKDIEILAGEQTTEFTLTLKESDMHKLRFVIKSDSDDIEYNNEYHSYIYIKPVSKILIIEKESDDSEKFVKSLGEEYDPTVRNISNTEKLPKTLDEFREYDEVVLMNIANADMPEGFIEMLYSYVNDIGGGLFTIGGTKIDEYDKEVPNMYNRNDMYEMSEDGISVPTLYQQMLPVQSVNYTPPLGVIIIIDRSGSMTGQLGGETRLDAAKRGAEAAILALSERDYCGIMSLDTEFQVEIPLIPATQQAKLRRTIQDIHDGGGTQYAPAIQRAGEVLMTNRSVERRHIILISDGEPGDDDPEDYLSAIRKNYNEWNITFSMVAIGIDSSARAEAMADAAAAGNGKFYPVLDSSLPDKMSQELHRSEIRDINPEPFQPRIRDHTSVVNGIDEKDIPMLGGYFGTKIRESASVPLAGEFVPILAHWNFGKGKVGSFMCDLKGEGWSKEFLESASGVKIINNALKTLLPTVDVRSTGISVDFTEDNYSTHASIFTEMNEGERIELSVYDVPAGEASETLLQKHTPTKEQGYSNITFRITEPGVYRVAIRKLDAQGNVLAENSIYRVFSYSEEYNVFVDGNDCGELMANIAAVGKGRLIPLDEPWQAYEEDIEDLHRVFDPRWLFIITSIVLFLLDIAVRKFKFKWIHEIVRDRREAKQASHESNGGSRTERV